MSLLVVSGKGPSLIGRDWLAKLRLDWQQLHHVSVSDTRLEQILSKHSECFKDELGTLRGFKAMLHVKEGAKPRFYKARTVPYSSKEKVEQELQHLQGQSIITPVQFSEWAAPIVPVTKQNGNIRVCGDYRLTVNQVLNTETYPLPRVEDIFAQLSGGLTFSKIDLANAYLQVEVADECKNFLTVCSHTIGYHLVYPQPRQYSKEQWIACCKDCHMLLLTRMILLSLVAPQKSITKTLIKF